LKLDAHMPANWTDLYRLAMLELDYGKLPQRIVEARDAIAMARSDWQALGLHDLRDMEDALRNLKLLEQEVQGSHPGKKEHSHVELTGEFVAMVDSSRRYVAVTDGVCRLLGFSREQLLTMKIDDVTAPTLREHVPETFHKYVELGFMTGKHQLLRRDGGIVNIAYQAMVFPDGCLVARWNPE
jgi:PAS domain S-box-containing protein